MCHALPPPPRRRGAYVDFFLERREAINNIRGESGSEGERVCVACAEVLVSESV